MKVTIEFNWWNEKDHQKEVPQGHRYMLTGHAIDRISRMVEKGFREGELYTLISDASYRGWWKIKIKED